MIAYEHADQAAQARQLIAEYYTAQQGEVPLMIIRGCRSARELLSEVRYGIFDFDGTLTSGAAHVQLLNACLPDKLREAGARDFALLDVGSRQDVQQPPPGPDFWARRPVRPGQIDTAAFITRGYERLIQARITRDQMRGAAAQIVLRPGVRELFGHFVACCVVSAGIEHMIRDCLERERLDALVAATRFIFDQAGGEVDFYTKSLVTEATKAQAAELFIYLMNPNPRHCLVLGDSIFDRTLFLPDTVNGLVMSPDNDSLKGAPDYLEQLWPRLHFVYAATGFGALNRALVAARP